MEKPHVVQMPGVSLADRLKKLQAESAALASELANHALADALRTAHALKEAGTCPSLAEPVRDRLARLGALIEKEAQSIEAVRARGQS